MLFFILSQLMCLSEIWGERAIQWMGNWLKLRITIKLRKSSAFMGFYERKNKVLLAAAAVEPKKSCWGNRKFCDVQQFQKRVQICKVEF